MESGCGYNLNTTCKLGYVLKKKNLNFDNFFLMLVFYDVQLCTGPRSSPESYGLLSPWQRQCPKYQSHPLQDTIIRILCGWMSNCTWILEVSCGVYWFLTKISRNFCIVLCLYDSCFFTALVLFQVCSFTKSTIFTDFKVATE